MSNSENPDPAARATDKQKYEAYEWLRSVSLSDNDESEYAAILMYEVARMKENEKSVEIVAEFIREAEA